MIEHLFKSGKSIFNHPIKMLYSYVEEGEVGLQAGVTTSSRNFKKAVDRNRVKRVMREAYRLQKLPLQQLIIHQQKSLAVFFIYTARELPKFEVVHQKMQLVLQKLVGELTTKTKED